MRGALGPEFISVDTTWPNQNLPQGEWELNKLTVVFAFMKNDRYGELTKVDIMTSYNVSHTDENEALFSIYRADYCASDCLSCK